MALQIQLRRDTSSNWASVNPVLAQGEVGLETDTMNMKIGDGTTHYNTLPIAFFSVATMDGGNSLGLTSGPDIDGGTAAG